MTMTNKKVSGNDSDICIMFFRRRCNRFIPSTKHPSVCFCGRCESAHDNSFEHRLLSPIKPRTRALKTIGTRFFRKCASHDPSEYDSEKWNIAKHTTLYPTNAYGIVEFENMLHPAKAHYLRLAFDTNASQIIHLFTKQWRLQLPNLIVSIHGGIQNFELQPRLRQVLKRGLLKAAKTAGAWIITSGLNTGVVKHVGDALFVRSRIRSNIVVIGIAPWGVVQGREQLKGQNKTVAYHSAAVTEDNSATLNSSHSCFLLVDDGTVGRYGSEVILRKHFEKYLTQQKISFHGHVGKQNVPVVCVIVEGGPNTIRILLEYLTEEPPVSAVVIDGSGRAADLIAFTYKNIQSDGSMSLVSQQQLLNAIEKVFNFNRRQTENTYVELLLCMTKREYITIYQMDDDDSKEQEDVDQAILRTLLRNHKASALEQFRLTLSWNRPDIAQTCLRTKRSELTQAQLDVCMFEALVDNRVEYIRLLIQNGVSIKNFLSFNRLQALYNTCGSNSTLHLIAKDVIRSANYHLQTRTYSLYEIGLIIEKLIGQGFRSSYTRRTIRHFCTRQPVSERQNFNVYLDAEQKEQHLQLHNNLTNEDSKRNSISEDPKFDFPFNELFVFAVLTKRHEMALFFWAHGEEALAKALIGCRLNKSLAREAQDDELDTEIADEFLSNAEDFQQRALALLDQCYQEDDDNATQILTCQLDNWSDWTCLDLSVTAYLRDFVAHKCCQQLLSDLWIGGMNVRKYLKWMVLLALFVPPALFLIDFKSSKELELMPQTEEEYFQNEEDLFDSDEYDNDSSNSSSDDSHSSSSVESHDGVLSLNNTDRDDEQAHEENQHETSTLRKRRRKSRKKKRKKQNSSSIHPDDQPPTSIVITTPNNLSDEIHLLTLNDVASNHHQASSPSVATTIPVNEEKESNDEKDVSNQRRTVRFRINNVRERVQQSMMYRSFCLFNRMIQRFFRRYRCCKKNDRNSTSNDNADQIPLTEKIYEFYNAPVTKFFQDLIFFILFLGIFTYVILIRTPPKPSVWEWILMSYLTTVAIDLIRELFMTNGTRWKTVLSVYFHDVLHLYDTFACLMFAVAFGLRLTESFRIVGRLLLCINLSLWYLRMFHFLVVSKEVGPYIHIAARNILDLLRLIVIVLIVLMSFGVSRQAIKFPNEDWNWHSVKEIFLEPYFMIYGEVYADKIDSPCNRTDDPTNPSCQFGHFITPITMTAFLLVCNILLLSMLMAQFTSTFMRLSRLSDQVWKFQRYHTILQYEQKPLLAPPLIIFSHLFILIRIIYRRCRRRKHIFSRGLKLFLNAKEIEKLRDFEEECVHEYLLAKEEKEKSTVEERMSTTSDRVSHMLTRVETLKRNGAHQTTVFQNFDERLERLEHMQATTVELLDTLVKNLRTSPNVKPIIIKSSSSLNSPEKKITDNDGEILDFTGVETPEDVSIPIKSLLSSSTGRTVRSGSVSSRKPINPTPILNAAGSQSILGTYLDYSTIKNPTASALTSNEELLGIGGSTARTASSSSVNIIEDTNRPDLYEAEETEHSIYGKLIKERFRKLSEVVEDIERTLPSHQQRQDDQSHITDDDETLSNLDWVDTGRRIAYNSTCVSRSDITQDENGTNFFPRDVQQLEEPREPSPSHLSIHSTTEEETKSTS